MLGILLDFGAIYELLRLLVYVPSRLWRQFLPVGPLNALPVTIADSDLYPFRACDRELRRALARTDTTWRRQAGRTAVVMCPAAGREPGPAPSKMLAR